MTVAQLTSGSQTCVIGTEHTLNSPAGGKTYVLNLDCNALVAVDILEVRLYKKIVSGGTLRLLDNPTEIAGPPGGDGFMSIPLPSAWGCSFTIKQTAGTGRVVPWSIETLD